MNPSRVFSLDEANSMLEELDQLLISFYARKEQFNRLHDEVLMRELIQQADHKTALYDPGRALESQERLLDLSMHQLEKELHKIRSLGCVVQNLERGWIDFPGTWQGQPVYFCWKRGEKMIQYYHTDKDSTERLPL